MESNPIEKKIVDEWAKYYHEASRRATKIENRITYILQTIFKEFGGKLETWWFDGAAEGEIGDLIRHYGPKTIGGFWTEGCLNKKPIIILKDGGEFELYEIPTRWLFEDFEEELHKGRKKFEERLEETLNAI